jgi:tetratricopeptide (TPR) repeat protein
MLAENLQALGRQEEAVAPARRAVMLSDGDPRARWIYYSALMEGARDTAAALAQLEALSRKEPDPLRVYDQMLRVYDARKDRAGILQTLDRIVATPGLESRGLAIAAGNYGRWGAPDKAASLYRRIVAQAPYEIEAWLRLAGLAMAEGDTLRAAAELRRALPFAKEEGGRSLEQIGRQLVGIYSAPIALDSLLAETPRDTAFEEGLGEAFAAHGKAENDAMRRRHLFGQALRIYTDLVGQDSSRARWQGILGEILLNLGRPSEARKAFRTADSLASDPRFKLGVAHGLIAEELYEEAVTILNPLLADTEPDFPLYDDMVFALGTAWMASGRVEKAQTLYRAASHLRPERQGFAFELGRTFLLEEQWASAIEVFESLLQGAEPNPPALRSALWELARAYERGGRFEKAVRAFERLIALDPGHDEALNYLGYMLAEKGLRLGEAEVFVRRALEAEGDNGAYLDSLGWILYRKGDYQGALRYLREALERERQRTIDPQDGRQLAAYRENLSVIYEHVGDVEHALRNTEGARSSWQKALEFDPANARLKEKIESLKSLPAEGPVGTIGP